MYIPNFLLFVYLLYIQPNRIYHSESKNFEEKHMLSSLFSDMRFFLERKNLLDDFLLRGSDFLLKTFPSELTNGFPLNFDKLREKLNKSLEDRFNSLSSKYIKE